MNFNDIIANIDPVLPAHGDTLLDDGSRLTYVYVPRQVLARDYSFSYLVTQGDGACSGWRFVDDAEFHALRGRSRGSFDLMSDFPSAKQVSFPSVPAFDEREEKDGNKYQTEAEVKLQTSGDLIAACKKLFTEITNTGCAGFDPSTARLVKMSPLFKPDTFEVITNPKTGLPIDFPVLVIAASCHPRFGVINMTQRIGYPQLGIKDRVCSYEIKLEIEREFVLKEVQKQTSIGFGFGYALPGVDVAKAFNPKDGDALLRNGKKLKKEEAEEDEKEIIKKEEEQKKKTKEEKEKSASKEEKPENKEGGKGSSGGGSGGSSDRDIVHFNATFRQRYAKLKIRTWERFAESLEKWECTEYD